MVNINKEVIQNLIVFLFFSFQTVSEWSVPSGAEVLVECTKRCSSASGV